MTTAAKAIIDRNINIFGSPEILHSDHGIEFEKKTHPSVTNDPDI